MRIQAVDIKKSITNFFHIGFIQSTNVVLQLILIRIVVNKVGLVANGLVLTSLSLAGIGATIINYATGQTAPKTVKFLIMKESNNESSLTDVFILRFLIFLLCLIPVFFVSFFFNTISIYLLCIIPLLLAEVLNPYAIYLGLEKMKIYNLGNFLSRLLGFFLVYILIQKNSDAPYVNMLIGISQVIVFSFLLIETWVKNKFLLGKIDYKKVFLLYKKNAPLAISNLIVHFQQSVFLYSLGIFGSPIVLGAYAIIDKIVWGGRMLIVAISNALYPIAIETYQNSRLNWLHFRKNVNRILAFGLIVVGILIFYFSTEIAQILTGDKYDEIVTHYIRYSSVLPFIIGMNVMNVMELILDDSYTTQLRISVFLLIFSVLCSVIFIFLLPSTYAIFYLLSVETICLVSYESRRLKIIKY